MDTDIISGMNWSLLSTGAVFSSVLPGEYMGGKTMFYPLQYSAIMPYRVS